MNTYGNLIGDTIQQSRVLYDVISPVTGKVIDHVSLATREEIVQAVSLLPERPRNMSAEEVFGFLQRLKEQILRHKDIFLKRPVLKPVLLQRTVWKLWIVQ
jgi:acyl-CoA reductase-like NAD-dependent aldehyde dehydrogenase